MEDDVKSMPMMGGSTSWRNSFTTDAGSDFEQTIKFVMDRPWMLHEFPQNAAEAGNRQYSEVNVIAKKEFAYDFVSNNFDLASIPDNLQIRQGDLIRLVIRENPTTGFWWHTNASRAHDSSIREVYNGFEAPDMRLIGASGKRIFVFQINDPAVQLKMGLSRPYAEEDFDEDFDDINDEPDDHIFSKRISFSIADADISIQQ